MKQNALLCLVIVLLGSATAATHASSIDDALLWLSQHQETDGHWDSRKYSAATKTDTATTSLALLALLGSGNSEKVGQYKDNVRRAVAWLSSKQDAAGNVFDGTDAPESSETLSAGALSILALAEAAAMSNKVETRAVAQKAIDHCTGNFPFHSGVDGNDAAVYTLDKSINTPSLGWYVMALKSAKVAGLKVPHGVFDALIIYLDSVEHKLDKANDDDVAPSEYWFRPNEKSHADHPAHRVTAVGCLCRQFLGWKREDLASTVNNFIKQSGPPLWLEGQRDADLYYGWIANLCTFQQGGDTWKRWNDPLKKSLIDNQCKDGDNAGTWSAKGYSSRWGMVGDTALATLSLQIWNRYPRIK